MRKLLLSAAAFAAALSLAGPAHAQVGNAPWCAVISMGTGAVYWDCQYWSVEACVPNVLAGNRGFCNHNPYYEGPPPARPRAHQRHKRHSRNG